MHKEKRAEEQHILSVSYLLPRMVAGYLLACLILISTLATGQTARANPAFSDTMPFLRVPWAAGSFYINGGNSYNCNDHSSQFTDDDAIDFSMPQKNVPLVAVFPGTITIGNDGASTALGNWVSVSSSTQYGWVATYGHMNTIVVHNGDIVQRGQLIGYSGNTGNSFGGHLHFRLRSHSIPSQDGFSYDGTKGISQKPEPMYGDSGTPYTGFGAYGACQNNSIGGPYTAPAPGGWYINQTPMDQSYLSPGATINVSFHSVGYSGSYPSNTTLKQVDITTWTKSSGWTIRSATASKNNANQWDVSASFPMPNEPLEVSVNVYSNDQGISASSSSGSINTLGDPAQLFQFAPNDIRHYCPTGATTCPSNLFAAIGTTDPGPGIGGGGSTDGVTLFVDTNYGGYNYTFGVGEYSDLSQFGLGQNVSSLLDTNADYHITLFDQKGLTGTPAYYDSNTPQLTGYWNDRALSMRVEQHSSDGVTLFTDASYGGSSHTFGVGEYSDLSQFGLDQNVSSLKDTNGAYHITFYDQKGLTGTPGYYDADTGQLTGYWNDRARSMRVELHSTDGVTPFVDANYGGANHTFGVGEYSDLSQFGLDQNVSSLKDTNGAYHITFYDQKGLTGTPGYYDADTPQLTGYWNDRARSMRVEKHRPTTCDPGTDGIIAYIDNNYQAGCLFITGDIPDLTSYNFEQVISSIRFAGTYTNSMQLAFYRQANYQDLCGTYSQDQADLQSCSDQAVSVKVLPFTPPTPTPVPPTPTATPSNSVELLTSPWHLTGNNGAAEADEGINPNALAGMTSVQVTFDLHETPFCVGHPCGDDEASLVFVQNGDWRAAVVTTYGNNGQNGSQTVTIPLTDFHKVGDVSTKLDPTQPVSNLHARFWNNNAFTVDITSVKLQSAATTTPTPTPVPPTPTPVPSATPTPHAPAPFTVYDETLAANWGDWSWCSTNNLSDTSHPNTGSYDLSWATTCAYGGLSLRLPAGFDTTNYSSLTFALQSSQANQTIQISLYDSAGNTGLPVQLTSYGGTPVAGKYTVYTIPLSAFQSTSTITGILIQDITNNASEPPMYIDTLAFK